MNAKVFFMKEGAPALLPLLRSRAQGDIIAWIMLHPEQEASLTEIAQATKTSSPTVMREVDRLAAAGLVHETRRGNQRLVRADTDNPVFEPLSALMAVTFGPVPVLRSLLESIDGVREAYIYGSWAARYDQQPGAVPGDIDVLVIGSSDLDELDEVAATAGQRLGREVSIRRVRPDAWDGAHDDPFKATVTSRPIVHLVGDAT